MKTKLSKHAIDYALYELKVYKDIKFKPKASTRQIIEKHIKRLEKFILKHGSY